MNGLPQKLPFRLLAFLSVYLGVGQLNAQESERVYSMSEVAAIDRENKLWRLVDANEGVDANVQRLLKDNIPVAEVEWFKPRLMELWGDIRPSLQLDWLDRVTLTKIEVLKTQYMIPMRQARVDDALGRLGGEDSSATPYEIRARWIEKIRALLDLEQWDNFRLMNSGRSIALCRLLKGFPTTAEERVTLCRVQRDYYQDRFLTFGDRPERVAIRGKEKELGYWRLMRDLLGDKRFTSYLESSDPGFGQMSFVLTQLAGVNSSKVLDLWWLRKRDELDDSRKLRDLARRERKSETYDLASALLGEEVIQVYLKDDDAKWLGKGAPYRMPAMRLALTMTEIQTDDANFRRRQ